MGIDPERWAASSQRDGFFTRILARFGKVGKIREPWKKRGRLEGLRKD
jgi:hypothetical protein